MTRVNATAADGFSLKPRRRTILAFMVTLMVASWSVGTRAAANERDVLSHGELDQIGMVQAWRRHLSVPTGRNSIVDHTILVHKTSPKEYVEVVGITAKAEPPKSAGSEKAVPSAADESPNAAPASGDPEASSDGGAATAVAKPPLYARYLLEVPDAAPGAAATPPVSSTSTATRLDRMTFGGRASFASSGLLDRAEAERRARNDIRRLKRRGINAEIQSREVPRIHMYTLANDGTIESRDAETGELMWLTRVGDRARGYSGMGVDDQHLSVVNGGELIKLDANDGSVYAVERLRFAPTHGPRHCGAYSVVPSIGNRVVAYPLEDVHGDIFSEIVRGASLAPATSGIGGEKIAWSTSEGFVYVMEASQQPSVDFRLGTDGTVRGSIAAAPGNRFFFGTTAGQIYGLRATRTGEVLWSRPTGDPIFDSPVVAGEKVLFLSSYGNLFCVEAETGNECWDRIVSGVAQVLAVIDDQIFTRSLSGALAVLSLEDGRLTQQLFAVSPRALQTNIVSDRMYLIDDNGTIQCLHRPGAEMPTLPVAFEKQQAEEAPDAEAEKTKKPAATPAGDPFGPGASDPFGGGGADPFGMGGADPFGGGGKADPFGG